ncbi:MAG: 2-succinyl-5-enolpyruvyl-6-hydroxy-3-cyclohexene-1-carboxylic-acid synthase [Bacteroidia bacterium]|jgi:2-succinyl-5-enolpyruvyl-6-hydroxy-3-cyclohexene-1-carboxylate synthase|nr:2-succinyl-5-enolpyruvyl-6-hydroxy-3-cyclohexene-1-carboxylic-acid synthase [Bacteroidia bacterium]
MNSSVNLIAHACYHYGVSHVVIAPGSRSAPLVLAFTNMPFTCFSAVDERSAAYMALGMATQLRKPVVLICTSGTAALNFFPAIAEAFYQRVPLIVITADRPRELLNQQDGQMIDQHNVYGNHVVDTYQWPDGQNVPSSATKRINELLDAAIQNQGPVHLNVPLREPLYQLSKPKPSLPKVQVKEQKLPLPTASMNLQLQEAWQLGKRKLVLIGQHPCDAALLIAVSELSKQPDVVVIADITSNLVTLNTANCYDYILTRAEPELQQLLAPDCIISLGGPVLSKSLKLWLRSLKPSFHVRINQRNETIDTYNHNAYQWQVHAPTLLGILTKGESKSEVTAYKQAWLYANEAVNNATQTYLSKPIWSELHAMHTVFKLLRDAVNVHLGNSSIIRHAASVGIYNPSWVVNSNRGTSGIDGCTSTAVGAALVNKRPTYLLTGDIAFLYDYNGLWANVPHSLTIIVWNNQGGRIFEWIEGPSGFPKQLPFFTTPHQQSLKALAQARGLTYYQCTSIPALSKLLQEQQYATKPRLIELTFEPNSIAKHLQTFKHLRLG